MFTLTMLTLESGEQCSIAGSGKMYEKFQKTGIIEGIFDAGVKIKK